MARLSNKIPQPHFGRLTDDQAAALTCPIEFGFVLDRSLSMASLKLSLMQCFNQILAEQAGLGPKASGTVILFDSEQVLLANGTPIAALPALSLSNYVPQGNTALLDGLGTAIEKIAMRYDAHPRRVLISVFTDGYENASARFNRTQIAELISARQTVSGWQFIFITPKRGVPFAQSLGILPPNIVDFECSPAGLASIFNRLARALTAYRLGDRKYSLLLTNSTSL